MRIELANLEDGRGKFTHSYQPEDLQLEDERVTLISPVVATGQVRQSGAEVFVTGNLNVQIRLECDRCLKNLELPVQADFKLDYITGKDYESSRKPELTEEEMTVSVFDGEVIDIDEVVKEQILLAVPARAICREDCKGICLTCGADLNETECGCKASDIDPRWEALKDLTRRE